MRGLARDQIPFANAVALTRSAVDCAAAERERLPKVFKLRNTGGNRGIRSTAAKKSDWPTSRSSVQWREYLARHQAGGVQHPTRSRTWAVPTLLVSRKRGAGGKIPARFKPREAIQEERAIVRTSGEIGGRAITEPWVQQKRKRKAKGTAGNVSLWFHLVHAIKLDPVLQAPEHVEPVFRAKFPAHFRRELAKAVQSRKK